jgi:hypothetical protein
MKRRNKFYLALLIPLAGCGGSGGPSLPFSGAWKGTLTTNSGVGVVALSVDSSGLLTGNVDSVPIYGSENTVGFVSFADLSSGHAFAGECVLGSDGRVVGLCPTGDLVLKR